MNRDLEKIWETIETWDAAHRDPTLGSYLNNPAPDGVVANLNSQLGGVLPADFLDSLRQHDGTADWTTKFCEGRFLDATLILQRTNERRVIVQDLLDADRRNGVSIERSVVPSGAVKGEFWSNLWIPFHETDWSVTCFDFDPATGGLVGQIIEVDWEGGLVKVVAKNYTEFLRLCAEQLPEEPSP